MGSQPYDRYEGEQEELRRFGLDRDPREDHAHEVELTERIAEQASLPPGHAGVWALARYRLGRGPSPFERAGTATTPRPPLAPGEEVTYRGEDGAGPARHGTVRRLIDEDGAAVVAFDGGGETAVSHRRARAQGRLMATVRQRTGRPDFLYEPSYRRRSRPT